MREIKFRAWDKVNGMVYNPAFQVLSAGQFEINRCFEQEYPKFMQYTGLKDKNGKEIYEGDIVKWRGPSGSDDGKSMEVWMPEIYDVENEGIYRASNWEVVGNIYENEGLLEAKEI